MRDELEDLTGAQYRKLYKEQQKEIETVIQLTEEKLSIYKDTALFFLGVNGKTELEE